jgi:hypothetical protein
LKFVGSLTTLTTLDAPSAACGVFTLLELLLFAATCVEPKVDCSSSFLRGEAALIAALGEAGRKIHLAEGDWKGKSFSLEE